MSQQYPGQGPYPGSHPQNVGQFHGGPPPAAPPKYRTLGRLARVAVALMAGTVLVSIIQTILMWLSYDDVKRLVYGLLSEDEIDTGAEAVVGAGPLLDGLGYLFAAAGIVVVIWLWQARENSEILKPPFATTYQGYDAGSSAHRHSTGWTVGGWLCPVVQFWYPLQVVGDVIRASEPPNQPGIARSGRIRSLLFGWWAAWVAFCVVAVGSGLFAGISFITWFIRLVNRADEANLTGDYVDIYDLQDYLVRLALGINIAFTVGTVLLIIAGATFSLLLLQVSTWHDERAPQSGVPLGPTLPYNSPSYLPPVDRTPQYAPRPPQTNPYHQGPYQAPPAQQPRPGGPYGPGGYGGTTGSSPNGPGPTHPQDTSPPTPRADPPRSPWPTREGGPPEYPSGSR
ncbi:DUF4328 domain-containing protein [Kribbella endophytica]